MGSGKGKNRRMQTGGLPPQIFADDLTPLDSTYEQLRAEFPEYVRRNADGDWEVDIWKEPGMFSPAIKKLNSLAREHRDAQQRVAEPPSTIDGIEQVDF